MWRACCRSRTRVRWVAAPARPLAGVPRRARGAVRFSDGIRFLERAGVPRFLELGPDGVLSSLVPDCLGEDADPVALPALRRNRPEREALVAFLAGAHVNGVEVDWTRLLAGGRRVDLPTYAFQRRRYWLAAGEGPRGRGRRVAAPRDRSRGPGRRRIRSRARAARLGGVAARRSGAGRAGVRLRPPGRAGIRLRALLPGTAQRVAARRRAVRRGRA